MDAIYETSGDEALGAQISYINQVIGSMGVESEEQLLIENTGEQLLNLLQQSGEQKLLGKKAKDTPRPETSMAYSSLFTGASREPQMLTELKKEIVSADQIDMLVSFIKWSGLRELLEELRIFTEKGGELRVICTSYMGATDVKAVEELNKLPNTEIKISYDTKRTRLHAKSYIFYRATGFTTAYIGSSNMSNAALTSGLEWNVKAAEKDMADTIEKVKATFESYWNDNEFVTYNESQKERLIQALRNEKYVGEGEERKFVFDIRPYSYQQEILDKLDVRWTWGGYDRYVLSNIYSLSGAVTEKRAQHVIANVEKYTTSVDEMKVLGFCVSREHARFMADCFNRSGIPALESDSNSGKEDRAAAKKRLEAGEIKVIFVVDLYNIYFATIKLASKRTAD